MAAANSTPIQLYYSNTSGSTPTSANLIVGELAINVPDGKLFYLDSTNTVNVIATTASAAGKFNSINFLGDDTRQYTAAAPYAYSNASFALGNTNATLITGLQGVNLTQNSNIDSAASYANAAFIHANNAYDWANTVYSNYAYTAYVNTLNLDGVNNTQNTNITYATGFAQAAFNKANTNAADITTLQGVDVTQNAGIAAALLKANGAFDKANTNTSDIATIQGVDLTQNTNITNATTIAQAAYNYANTLSGGTASDGVARALAADAYTKANGAFTVANNAVANTSTITLAGNLNVPGQANVAQRFSVGVGSYTILPNLIAQFTGTSDYYSQINQQNLSPKGSGDIVVTADNGTDEANYIDMGISGSDYDNTTPNAFAMTQPNDGYLMLVGNAGQNYGGNLFIGTAGSGSYADISIIQGNTFDETARFKYGGNIEFYRPLVANSFTTKDGVDVITYTNTANTYLQSLIDTKVNKSGDTITGTLTINNTSAANALIVYGNTYFSTDVFVQGNLYFSGGSTQISSNNLTINDPIIYLANNNPANSVDIGIVGHFISDHYQHTGLVRDHADGKWKLFSNVAAEPTTTIDLTDAAWDTLKVGAIEAANNLFVKGTDVQSYANTIFVHANAAFDSANSKVASVSGTSGRITSSGTTTVTVDLATTGITAGSYSYPALQADAYGRITSISNQTPVTSFNTRTGSVTLSSTDVTDALTFTPVSTSTRTSDLALQSGLDAAQNTNISSAASYANAAFEAANNAYTAGGVIAGSYANSAFAVANSASVYANGAFIQANTATNNAAGASEYANAAYAQANTATNNAEGASQYANSAYNQANTATTNAATADSKAVSAGSYANAAFAQANTVTTNSIVAGNYANSAYAQANTATSNAAGASQYANAAFDQANTATSNALAASSYANSGFTQANTSALNAASASSYANSAFLQANVATTATTSAFIKANAAYQSQNTTGSYANSAYAQANVAQDTGTSAGNYANASFLAANTAFSTGSSGGLYANGAFIKANTAFIATNAAFDQANTNATNITLVQGVDLAQNAAITTAGSYANSAYVQANNATNDAATADSKAVTAGNYANSAYAQANSAFNYAGTAESKALSAGTYANGAFVQANSAYTLAQNAYDTANTAGLAVFAYAQANAAFDQANTNATNITLVQGVDVWQNTYIQTVESKSAVAGSYANSAFEVANSASSIGQSSYNFANTLSTGAANDAAARIIANAAFLQANTALTEAISGATVTGAYNQANNAYERANNSLNANTGGTITGPLTITGGDLSVTGNIYIQGTTTVIATNNITVDDTLLYIANNNPSNLNEIGFVGHFTSGTYQHTGLVRDHADNKWKLFSNVAEPGQTTVSFTNAIYDTLKVGGLESDLLTIKGIDLQTFANNSYNQANTAINNAAGASNYANGAFTQANLAISNALSASSYANAAFAASNTNATNITLTQGVDATQNNNISLIQGVDLTQNTNITTANNNAIGAGIYANGAFTQANTAINNAAGASQYANAAFTKANTALANTSGAIFAGDLNVTGNIAAANITNATSIIGTTANTTIISGVYSTIFDNAGRITTNSTLSATSNTSGVLVIPGGIGLQGNLYSGNVVITGSGNGITFVDGTTQITSATPMGIYANGAFVQANAAFTVANTASNTSTSAASYANGSFIQANAAFAAANAAFATANSSAGAAAAGSYANSAFAAANSAGSYANAAFTLANTHTTQIALGLGIDTTQNTNITTANNNAISAGSYANAAFTKANTALANTTGTLAGDLTITGNTTVSGNITTTNITGTTANTIIVAGNYSTTFDNAGRILVSSNVATTSNTTGALIVTGGIGLQGNLYTGGIVVTGSGNGITFVDGTTQVTSPTIIGTYANAAFIVANTASSTANSAGVYANGAFNFANTVYYFTAASFDKANAAFIQASNAWNYANTISAVPGQDGIDNTQNTSITAAFIQANAAFAAANAVGGGSTSAGPYANAAFAVANSAASYANAAFLQANAAFAQANTGGAGTDTWAREQANAAFLQANAAFAQANTGSGSGGNVVTQAYTTRTYTGTGSANTFTVTNGTTANTVLVTENGVLQTPITDYTISGTTLTFTTPPVANVNIQIRELGNIVSEPVANAAFLQANAAFTKANTATTIGKSIAMSIVFGG